ncbi:MAG: cation:proton antiporter, partial [Ketobacteraceae bacterium]|nr:cation:proton antiporter [Ketobacteraceae bacterium]
PEELTVLLEGESLFNDATAIVVFTLLVSLLESGHSPTTTSTLMNFSYTLAGGVVIGLVTGGIAALLNRWLNGPFHQAITCLFAAFMALYAAEHWAGASGIIAVLSAGLVLGESHRRRKQDSGEFTENFWQFLGYMANAIVFILVGVTITTGMFTSHWLAMGLGIIGAIIARFIVIYGLLPLLVKLLPGQSLNPDYKPILWAGGLRGAIALALALSIPQSIESWYTIQSVAYGVVLFTLFVQAPLMPWITRRFLGSETD